jgi:hypothetical protein
VLTAVLRLPWPHVVRRVREAVAAHPAERRGVADALADLPTALRRRRVLPPEVLADLDLLEGRRRPRTQPASTP